MAYISLPGTSGNYASTADVNLLDADTAHCVQSRGLFTGGTVTAGSGFGDTVLLFANSNPGAFYIIDGRSGAITVSPATEYTASFVMQTDAAHGRHRAYIEWYDSGSSLLSSSFGSYVTASDDAVAVAVTATAPASAAEVRLIVQTEAGGSIADVSFHSVMFTEGSDGTFVPSLRIVGDLDIEAKFTPNDITSFQRIINTRGGLSGFSMLVSSTSSEMYFEFGNGSSTRPWTDAQAGLTVGTTVTMRATFDASTGSVELFKDGVSVDTHSVTAGAMTLSGEPLDVGFKSGVPEQPFNGDIYYAIVRDGIDGPVVAKFDAEEMVNHASVQVTDTDTWVGDNDSRTWTLNGADSTAYYPELLGGGTDAVMSHLSNLDSPPASLGIVGALTEKAGLSVDTDYRFALLSYLNIDT